MLGLAAQPAPTLAQVKPEDVLPIDGTVTLATLSGPPQGVAEQLVRKLDAAALRSRLALLADPRAAPDFRLQGYLIANRSRSGAEMSYVWDVFDRQGVKVGRTSGSEVIVGATAGADPWPAVSEAVLQRIADQAIVAVVSRNPPAASAQSTASRTKRTAK